MKFSITLGLIAAVALGACERLERVGQAPDLTPASQSAETHAMQVAAFPTDIPRTRDVDRASLWSGSQQSLLGDRRAQKTGDILTVVIEIDDKAEFSASSDRSRSGSDSMEVGEFFGVNTLRPLNNFTVTPNLSTTSSSSSSGDGKVSRNEKLTLRVAATVVGQLPNGILQIQGTQEVRVNFELRELLVTGYVRPQDISRQNEIAYDKIASARISYGGRGNISDVQQPRVGQQIADIVLPF